MGNRERLIGNESGVILLITTILVILLASVVAVYLDLIQTEMKSIVSYRDAKGALYLAEAGIERAIWELRPGRSTWEWDKGYESEALGSGSYRVEVLAQHKFSGSTDMRFEVEVNIDPASTARTIYLLLIWEPDTGADWNLSLYDPANKLVAQAVEGDNPEVITYEASLSGTYMIRVTNQAGIPYKLFVAHPDRPEGIASNKRWLLATGTVNGLSRRVGIDLNNCRATLPDFSAAPRPDFNYLLYAGQKIIFTNFDSRALINIKGKVQAKGGKSRTRSYDDIDYSLSEASHVYIAGDAVIGDLLTTPPSFSDSDYHNYRAYAQAHGTYFPDGIEFADFIAAHLDSTISGVFYVPDDISLDLQNRTLTIKGMIVSHRSIVTMGTDEEKVKGSKGKGKGVVFISNGGRLIIEPQSFAGLPDSDLYAMVSRWNIDISGAAVPLTIESQGFFCSKSDIRIIVSKDQEVNINARLVAENNIEMIHQVGTHKTGTIVMYDGASAENEVGHWREFAPPVN